MLLTPPVPQSLDLLDDGDVQLSTRDRAALDAIEYEPCLTGMFVLDRAIASALAGRDPATVCQPVLDRRQSAQGDFAGRA